MFNLSLYYFVYIFVTILFTLFIACDLEKKYGFNFFYNLDNFYVFLSLFTWNLILVAYSFWFYIWFFNLFF